MEVWWWDIKNQISCSNVQSFHDTGIDIDWEYPAQRGGVAADKANFVLLLQQLKETLQPIDKLVTIAVGAARQSASVSYNIPEVVKHVDFINLMTYDLHGSWDGVTGLMIHMFKHYILLHLWMLQSRNPQSLVQQLEGFKFGLKRWCLCEVLAVKRMSKGEAHRWNSNLWQNIYVSKRK